MDRSHNGAHELGQLLVKCNKLGTRNYANGVGRKSKICDQTDTCGSENCNRSLPEFNRDEHTGGVEVELTHIDGMVSK